MNNKDIPLSKSLSWLLRHGAVKEGLGVSPEGYVNVNKILQHKCIRGNFTQADIERVVKFNDKQRFRIRPNPVTGVLEIKATQGHSIVHITNAGLAPILVPKYKSVVHGTYFKCWPLIKRVGLSRMTRQHIHFAKGTLQNTSIISGIRKNVQIYVFLNLQKALSDGLRFYESENGVILSPGNEKGFIEPKYFSKVIAVSTGMSLV